MLEENKPKKEGIIMYFKNFVVFGINYKEYELQERESFIKHSPTTFIEQLYENGKITSYVVVSTCLRVEYYVELADNYTLSELKEGLNMSQLFFKEGDIALNYLFRVICGFESVIKGEDQILSQIKKAFSTSLEEGHTTSTMNTIFNKAIELGKKFRSESQISHNALSLEGISLKLIKNKVKNLENCSILILGVGELAIDILKLLKKENYKSLTITNRSYHKAFEISNIYGANLIGFNEKLDEIVKSDVIISATSAPHLVIKYEDIAERLDKNKEYIFLDLAVPRDIDVELSTLENTHLYNIDDVWKVYYENLESRDTILYQYEYLIGEQIENLNRWAMFKKGLKR